MQITTYDFTFYFMNFVLFCFLSFFFDFGCCFSSLLTRKSLTQNLCEHLSICTDWEWGNYNGVTQFVWIFYQVKKRQKEKNTAWSVFFFRCCCCCFSSCHLSRDGASLNNDRYRIFLVRTSLRFSLSLAASLTNDHKCAQCTWFFHKHK